jgi:transcriptional regulator with XRE-family HTH domain
MSKGGVSDLEQGRRKPTWESVLSLAGALGVSTDEFAKEPGHHQSRPQGRPIKRKPAGSEEAGITPPIEEAKPKRPRGRPRKESQAEQSETPPTTPKLRGKKGPSA